MLEWVGTCRMAWHHVMLAARRSAWHRVFALLVFCSTASVAPDALAALRFFVMGDAPYSATDLERLPGLLAAAEASEPTFLVHVGDIKAGGGPCHDSALETVRQIFARVNKPIVYSIGDNEWTDCHRTSAGGYDPLERLAFLRERFFTETSTLRLDELQAQRIGLPEILWFEKEAILFLNLHVVGSHNGQRLTGIAARRAFTARERANLDLLRSTQRRIEQRPPLALVVFSHANPNLDTRNATAGYRTMRAALLDLFERFGGPTLFIHGDTHTHRIDQPVTGHPALPQPDLTRLEVPGYPSLAGVEVTIRPREQPPFRFSMVRPPDEAFVH